jgi:hypothetical protein
VTMRRQMLMAMISTAMVAMAQQAEPKETISNGGVFHSLYAAPVAGMPYSAEQVHDRSKMLNTGTKIEHAGKHFVARDSAGRIRVEQPCGCPADHEQMVEVYVLDPIAHTLTTWIQGGSAPRVATVAKIPERNEAEEKPQPVRVGDSSRPQPIITTDQLPVEIIENLPMKVTRTTTIVPAGRSHNDSPITKVHTVWTSEDLKLTFKEQWDDPRTGTRVVGLVNVSRKEPDAKLFRVPPGFQVTDAKESLQRLANKLEEHSSM